MDENRKIKCEMCGNTTVNEVYCSGYFLCEECAKAANKRLIEKAQT